MRAAIAYLRCSTTKQARKNLSLPAQHDAIQKRVVQEAKPTTLIKLFQDAGISGKSADERPGLQAMLAWIEVHPGEVKRLYVYDYKRLARNQEDAYLIRKRMKRAGIEIVALTQPTTGDPIADVLLNSVYDATAEMERQMLRKVVRRGRLQALKGGFWPFNLAPLGYERRGDPNDAGVVRFKLAIDEAQAPVARRIFDMYLAGDGAKRIAAALTAERVLSRRWRATHISKIIRNPVYYGAASMKDEVLNEAAFPAIVDKETWDRAQQVRLARRRKPREIQGLNNGEHGLLTQVLICGVCHGRMRVNRGGSAKSGWHYYYACSNRMDNRESCRGITTRVDHLDGLITDRIESEVLTGDALSAIVRDTLASTDSTAQLDIDRERQELEARLEVLDKKREKLVRAVADEVFTLAEARSQMESIRTECGAVGERLMALPVAVAVQRPEDVDIDAFREGLQRRWHAREMAERRRAVAAMIDKIELSPGEALVHYSWKPESASYTHHAPPGPP